MKTINEIADEIDGFLLAEKNDQIVEVSNLARSEKNYLFKRFDRDCYFKSRIIINRTEEETGNLLIIWFILVQRNKNTN